MHNFEQVLYLNRSKDFSLYRSSLKAAIVKSDKTCGGLPVGPMPNNYTYGHQCSSSHDCSPAVLPRCGSPDRPCFCCANISVMCSTTGASTIFLDIALFDPRECVMRQVPRCDASLWSV